MEGLNTRTIRISTAGQMTPEDWEKWKANFWKYVAPTLSIFFGQLALGVDWRAAGMVAMFAIYQSLSDYLGKKNGQQIYVEPPETPQTAG